MEVWEYAVTDGSHIDDITAHYRARSPQGNEWSIMVCQIAPGEFAWTIDSDRHLLRESRENPLASVDEAVATTVAYLQRS
jgi:hypothetical protein